MKKLLLRFLSVGLALIVFSVQSMAFTTIASSTNSDEEVEAVTNFEENEIYNAFDEVNPLVAYMQNNEDVTYDELASTHSDLVENINSSAALALSSSSDTPPILSAFIWGCLFNWVGILIVGITTNFDNQQITKSLWGCLINSFLLGGGWGCSYYYGYW